jgi:hypothetical protein
VSGGDLIRKLTLEDTNKEHPTPKLWHSIAFCLKYKSGGHVTQSSQLALDDRCHRLFIRRLGLQYSRDILDHD